MQRRFGCDTNREKTEAAVARSGFPQAFPTCVSNGSDRVF